MRRPRLEHIDARRLLRQHDRIALREDHDAGGQADRRRRRCGERQRHQRVECRVLRRHRRRRDLWIRQHDVLAGPQRLEPGRLRSLGGRHELVGLDTQAHVDVEQAEMHRASVAASAEDTLGAWPVTTSPSRRR